MFTLYIANKNYSSWSLRPWILMKGLGIPFEERLVVFAGADNFDTFRNFAPNGKVPCLIDGDITVWDSLAITEYLAEKNVGVWPIELESRAWARSICAEMHSGFNVLRDICSMNCGIRVKLHQQPENLIRDWQRVDEIWCEGLQRFRGPFLAGQQFSAADAFYAPVVFRAQTYGIELSATAMSYVSRMLDFAPMQDWYQQAIKETWRDEPHEAETRLIGEWLQDLRAK